MSAELIAIVGVGVALGVAMITSLRSLRTDFRAEMGDMRTEMRDMRRDVGDLRDRISLLEGLFKGFVERTGEAPNAA